MSIHIFKVKLLQKSYFQTHGWQLQIVCVEVDLLDNFLISWSPRGEKKLNRSDICSKVGKDL